MAQASTQEHDRKTRLDGLRTALAAHQLDAYLVLSADEHLNEYLPEHRKRREWVTGFTGSVGDCLVSREASWVFVDSRYYEQADREVDTSLCHIFKVGMEGHLGLTEQLEHLASKAGASGFKLGFDPFSVSMQWLKKLDDVAEKCPLILVPTATNLVDLVASQLSGSLPTPGSQPVIALPESLTGCSLPEKLAQVRKGMKELNVDVLPVTKLDHIAWLVNLRGQDIPYNPVFISYAIITDNHALLFANGSALTAESQASLNGHVGVYPYDQYAPALKTVLEQDYGSRLPVVLLDTVSTTAGTLRIVEQTTAQIRKARSPIELLKAIKNPTELAAIHDAHLKAGRAKIRLFAWLSEQIAQKQSASISELDIANYLEARYAEEEGFRGLSFNTIAGVGPNSSIVHYGTPDPTCMLTPGQFLLVDSGAHYGGGTTDDTRTWFIGEADLTQKTCYTEVLKAHINTSMQVFPKGTEGARLDGITRACLWSNGLDYGHGTGHGVGAYLNVHEGPQGIHRMASEPLIPGMVLSIEPGYYRPGWGGIRHENLYSVVEIPPDRVPSPFGSLDKPWYGFDVLTLIPFDPQPILWPLLSDDHKHWLKAYHRKVWEKHEGHLDPATRQWLARICEPYIAI